MHQNFKSFVFCFLPVVLLAFAASLAQSHVRSQSFSRWVFSDSQVQVRLHASAVEITRLGVLHESAAADLGQLLAAHLRKTLLVTSANGNSCAAVSVLPGAVGGSSGRVSVDAVFSCGDANGVDDMEDIRVVNNAFFAVAPSHLHFARFANASGERVEKLFTDAQREHSFSTQGQPPQEWWQVFYQYFWLGGEHILLGADHLAFVLCLLLLCGFSTRLVLAISGFTLGHSLALVLAVFDVVRPAVAAVEALIGFSIVVVALEWVLRNLPVASQVRVILAYGMLLVFAMAMSFEATQPVLSPLVLLGLAVFTFCYLFLAMGSGLTLILLITSLFGLVHGFGFSSSLLQIGMPTGQVAVSLLAFNLGVEAGQLLFCAVLLGLGFVLARRLSDIQRLVFTAWLVAGLAALGTYWFIARGIAPP